MAQLKCQECSAAVVSVEERLCSSEGEQSVRSWRAAAAPQEHRAALESAGSGCVQTVNPPCHHGVLGERVASIYCKTESEGLGSATHSSA